MNIGTYKIPNNPNRLPKLIELTKTIYDTFEDNVIPKAYSNDALAQLLKHKSAKNSAFWNELAALKVYGLFTSIGRSDLQVTDIGKDITYGTSEQVNTAALKAIMNIPLWKMLYEKYGTQLPTENFWAKLQAITGIDAKVARSNEQYVTEAFRLDTSLIKDVNQPSPEVNDLTETPMVEKTNQPLQTPCGIVSFGSSVDYSIWVKRDPKSIAFAESQIEAIKAWLKFQKERIEEKQEL